MRARGNILVLGLPSAIALSYLYSFALTYLTSDPQQYGIYRQRHDWLLMHVVAGIVALLLGPVQLWLGLNRRTAFTHRILGIVYVCGVAVGSTAAFYLASHSDFGWVFGLGFGAMASAWILTTALATLAICMRRVEQHREWMIRSYVVTFGFVTFRVLDSLLEMKKVGTIIERMTAASWLAWTVPLLITESIMQGRKIFQKRANTSGRLHDGTVYTATPEPTPFEPRDPVAARTSRIADDTASGFSLGRK
jgi:uncharacterized membrane protein